MHRNQQAGESLLPILQVGDVLISPDILTEHFCCDYAKCGGACCIEGNAGAPVAMEEIGEIEASADVIWPELTAAAQAVIDRQGVVYTDQEGDLVTSIVGGKECVFASITRNPSPETHHPTTCLCLLEKAFRQGRTSFCKPLSCSLYPIRAKQFSNGTIGLNYNRWDICRDAIAKGKAQGIRVYQFLKEPLIRRFGTAWYEDLEALVGELKEQGML